MTETKQPGYVQAGWIHTHPTEAPQGELAPLHESLKPADIRDGWRQEPVFRMQGRAAPAAVVGPSEAGLVLAAIESGEWEIRRHLPQQCFTDEANRRHAWSVVRGMAPYCTEDGVHRVWTGATPMEALLNGAKALNLTLPVAPATQPAQGDALTQAARDVLAERQRQIIDEGWTPEHDDKEHLPGELALAAASYLCADERDAPPAIWPWDWSWWKPRDRRRNLIKSGALILAEIERIDRAQAKKGLE